MFFNVFFRGVRRRLFGLLFVATFRVRITSSAADATAFDLLSQNIEPRRNSRVKRCRERPQKMKRK